MVLTGKCKEDFFKKVSIEAFDFLKRDVLQNSLIIEFFDSVGIYITVNYNFIQAKFTNSVKDKDTILHRGGLYSARQEATTEAIKKANEIYNEKES